MSRKPTDQNQGNLDFGYPRLPSRDSVGAFPMMPPKPPLRQTTVPTFKEWSDAGYMMPPKPPLRQTTVPKDPHAAFSSSDPHTFKEWSDAGYRIKKGSKSSRRNQDGVPLFEPEQAYDPDVRSYGFGGYSGSGDDDPDSEGYNDFGSGAYDPD